MKLLIGLLLLVLAACGSAVPAPSCPTGQTLIGGACCADANGNGQCDGAEPKPAVTPPTPPEVKPAPPVAVTPVPKEEVPAEPVQGSMAELQAKVQQNVKSYSYSYRDITYKVLGDTVRVDLGKFIRPDGTNAANTIYLNAKTNTAEAYCEGGPTTTRMCDRNQRGPFTVPYTTYAEKLPLAWIEDFADARVVKVTADAQTIGSIPTDRWDIVDDGQQISLWVLAKYGVPVRIVTPQGETNFVAMSVNTVKPEDVVPHPDVRT